MQIGEMLKSGEKHDGRSPDYDDWNLNGDILFWYPVLDRAIELSSMGIRVDEEAFEYQLRVSGCEDRRSLDFHKVLLEWRTTIYNRWRNRTIKNMYVLFK